MIETATCDDPNWWVTPLNQYFQLAACLPPAPDKPRWLICDRCRNPLGCLANSRGVAFGSFDMRDWAQGALLGSTVISERRVLLKCGRCGREKLWHRNKDIKGL